MHHSSGYKRARTVYTLKDKELLSGIVKNLPYEGFELKDKKEHYSSYHDGHRTLAITDDKYADDPAPKGYYRVTIFTNAVN